MEENSITPQQRRLSGGKLEDNLLATLNVKQFPDKLYDQLRARAENEHRSIAQEVVHLLDQAIQKPQPRSILSLRGLGKQHWENIDAAEHIRSERETWD